jgi:hypothetical protein
MKVGLAHMTVSWEDASHVFDSVDEVGYLGVDSQLHCHRSPHFLSRSEAQGLPLRGTARKAEPSLVILKAGFQVFCCGFQSNRCKREGGII